MVGYNVLQFTGFETRHDLLGLVLPVSGGRQVLQHLWFANCCCNSLRPRQLFSSQFVAGSLLMLSGSDWAESERAAKVLW